jgi:hypothetical protein
MNWALDMYDGPFGLPAPTKLRKQNIAKQGYEDGAGFPCSRSLSLKPVIKPLENLFPRGLDHIAMPLTLIPRNLHCVSTCQGTGKKGTGILWVNKVIRCPLHYQDGRLGFSFPRDVLF